MFRILFQYKQITLIVLSHIFLFFTTSLTFIIRTIIFINKSTLQISINRCNLLDLFFNFGHLLNDALT